MAGDAEWTNSATKPVLRLLDESDLALSASGIVYNLQQRLERPPSEATVTRALKGLREHGLVKQPYRSLYQITDRGRAYLAGDLGSEDIDRE